MFISSFLAILSAGLIITIYNHSFLKHERWCKTADAFCVNIEKVIIDYFDSQNDKEKRTVMLKKFYAYLDAFILFAGKKSEQRIDALLKELVRIKLDNSDDQDEKKSDEEEEIMRRALNTLAIIRHELTQQAARPTLPF